MKILIASIIIVSGIINMIADVFLVSGKSYKVKNQSRDEILTNTPAKHIIASGIIGFIVIGFWVTPIYYLSQIPGYLGTMTSFAFALYITAIAVYHVSCSYTFIALKVDPDSAKQIKTFFMAGKFISAGWGMIYSALIIALSLKGVLELKPLHYLTLPPVSVVLVSMVLGKVLKRVPHYTSVSGTFSQIIAFLSTIHFMILNGYV